MAIVQPFVRALSNAVFRDHAHFTATSVFYVVLSRDRAGHAFRWKRRLLERYAAVHGAIPLDLARAEALVGFLELDVACDVFREASAPLREPPSRGKQYLVVVTDDDTLSVGECPRMPTDQELLGIRREHLLRAAQGGGHG